MKAFSMGVAQSAGLSDASLQDCRPMAAAQHAQSRAAHAGERKGGGGFC